MKPYWKVTLWYLGFGALWIFATDKAMQVLSPSMEILTFSQTIKGWFFVAASGALIFYLTRKACLKQLAETREKHLVFHKTLEGAHHILLNYLNQMQLVTLEAENCEAFDKETLKLAHDVSHKAEEALAKLRTVEKLTAGDIHSALYGGQPPGK